MYDRLIQEEDVQRKLTSLFWAVVVIVSVILMFYARHKVSAK